jgi:hypothetical protein
MVEGAGTGGPLLQYSVLGTQYSVRRASELGASNPEFGFSDIESKGKSWRAGTAWRRTGEGPSLHAGRTP